MTNGGLQFNLIELLSILGLVQSVYIIVHMAFRSGGISQAKIPFLYFLFLALAFLLIAAQSRWQAFVPYYAGMKWGLWASLAPLSMLLILKILRAEKELSVFYWLFLMLVPLGYVSSGLLGDSFGDKGSWYQIHAIIIGASSLLVIWSKRAWLDTMHRRRKGPERYWLIICLLIVNIGLLSVDFGLLKGAIDYQAAEIIRVLIGILFTYIASTSLFRLFPQSELVSKKTEETLSVNDLEIASKIEDLLYLDKVYQEASYGRSDMAKELNISDANLSKIVKLYFEKGVPFLLNELRIKEAKDMLMNTDIDITTIAGESGFNSIATFNRVFKEIEGISPSEYRKKDI